ncbi:MAG: DUF1801 domain-containing protein [Bryobacteraceae bacterium]|nr:DUF1801 domain-containing protein [Bryobacteraceae bacterium]
MTSPAATVAEYVASLPPERQAAITTVRQTIRKHLPKGVVETMGYGMISYVVPHKLYPAGYHCKPADPLPFAGLASQKNHMALYLMTVYQSPAMETWLREAFAKSGKKLDLGKSCLRFRKLESLPLDVIGEAIARVPLAEYIANYEAALARPR